MACGGDAGMSDAQASLPHFHRAAIQRFSFFQLPLGVLQSRQIAERHTDLVVVWPVSLLEDRERPEVQGLRFLERARSIEQSRECGQVSRYVGVVPPQRPLSNLDRAPGVRLTVGEASALMLQAAEIVIERGDAGVIRS